MPQSRQLAAIMFTDIAGYSALMDQHEEKALGLLNRNRDIQKPLIKQFQGRWLKEMGDGVLASFDTVSNAVYCAGAIQEACANDGELNLRIGIHLGEVIFEDGDVFGSGVNIASRLEPLAQAGEIVVSGAVHHNINNKPGISSISWKEARLKNVEEPIKIYRVKVKVPESIQLNSIRKSPKPVKRISRFKSLAWPAALLSLVLLFSIYYFFQKSTIESETQSVTSNVQPSIAVLPFVNMSNDPDQEYFSDGISEEIINTLAQLPNLKVTSRTSAFQFRGRGLDIKQIAETLGVVTVLEGSVRKAGNRIKVTAQLINAADGFHLWSQTYERELDDIFDIQEELSVSIVQALRLQMANDNSLNNRQGTSNVAAYNLYLQGRYFWNKRNQDGMEKSIGYFKQALDIDPTYSMAYVGLADAYNMLAGWAYMENTSGFQMAKAAAIKALEFDDQLGPAYAALAYVQLGYDWNWDEARKNFLRAQELSPNYAPAFYWYSEYCTAVGEVTDAVLYMEKAISLDPLSLIVNSELAWLYMFDAGKNALALEQANKALEMDAGFLPLHFYLYHMHYHLNNQQLAFEHFITYTAWYDPQIMEKIFEQSGWNGVGKELISAIEKGKGPETISPITIAEYYCHNEEYDKALDYIELAFNDRDYFLTHIAAWPVFKPLHTKARFGKVINDMGLDISKLGPFL